MRVLISQQQKSNDNFLLVECKIRAITLDYKTSDGLSELSLKRAIIFSVLMNNEVRLRGLRNNEMRDRS